MMKAVKKILIALAVVFIAIQFIPSGIPENIPEDKNSIANSSLAAGPVLDQINKSCFDCHSNQVKFPWYSRLAPSSWLLAIHISEGKSHLNFSEWEAYSNREKIGLLEAIKDEVGSGKMPLKSYVLIHRDAKLNSEEISALLKWADEASARILE
ncbi:MAG: heme-binding domain-containing protein [Bacteroidales bacterium]|nr:heme-binding domain-containing protein [Bacteroidales bacterium]